MIKYTLGFFAIVILFFSSCLKSEDQVFIPDPLIQLGKDTVIIRKFLTEKSIPATKYDVTGIYYQIINPGTGEIIPQANSTIKYKYELRLLNDTTIRKSPDTGVEAKLGTLISGLQLGIPLIRHHGKIRLIIASGYAYGRYGSIDGYVPPNAILDYDIELLDVK